jgi:hypothetical protein
MSAGVQRRKIAVTLNTHGESLSPVDAVVRCQVSEQPRMPNATT